MNIIYYDLYYTVIKNWKEREIEDNQYENDYINFNDILPNQYIGRKKDSVRLTYRKMRSQIIHIKKNFYYINDNE